MSDGIVKFLEDLERYKWDLRSQISIIDETDIDKLIKDYYGDEEDEELNVNTIAKEANGKVSSFVEEKIKQRLKETCSDEQIKFLENIAKNEKEIRKLIESIYCYEPMIVLEHTINRKLDKLKQLLFGEEK